MEKNKKCLNCGEELIGKQIMYCSVGCDSKYWAEHHKNEVHEYHKKYNIINSKKNIEYQREYRKKNNKLLLKNKKKYYKEKRKEILEYKYIYKIKRRREDPIYRMNCNFSRNINHSLKLKKLSKKKRHWEDIVGYTVQELKQHLEKLFQTNMTWKNYGKWHIDHIIPISFFKYKSMEDVEFKYCWSLDNLQPLWAKDNLSKSSKIFAKWLINRYYI